WRHRCHHRPRPVRRHAGFRRRVPTGGGGRAVMSLAKRIIPCLDIKNGQVVKGVKFIDIKAAGDPVDRARLYDQQGADELVLLDISASRSGREALFKLVERVASEIFISLTVGGGVNDLADIQHLLSAGADKVSINTAAVKNPEFVREAAARFGRQCIVVAMDVRNVAGKSHAPRWELFTHGGRKATGIDALTWARRMADYGAGELLVTSMDKDGTKSGFDLQLTRSLSDSVDIPIIASGGVGSLEDLYNGLEEGRADAVLAASIFHYEIGRAHV